MAGEPIAEFGFPGPLRDRLVGAILRGEKTATSSLHVGYADDTQGFPQTGDVEVVIDSLGQPVAEIETVEVRVLRVADVDIGFARDEGEGFDSVAEWRREHERFWQSDEVRAELGQPEFRVDDDTLIVAQRFRLVRELG